MKKIIQITDTHVSRRGQKILGIDPVARLKIIIESVNTNHTDADYCVFTGDLTDRGDIESYERFYELVSFSQDPVQVASGQS